MIKIIRGSNQSAPNTTQILTSKISQITQEEGYLYVGYPIIGSPTGPVTCDALLVSKELGVVIFDLVENTDIGDFAERQNKFATLLESKLKPFQNLTERRRLKFEISTITFAPMVRVLPEIQDAEINIANSDNLQNILTRFRWDSTDIVYQNLTAAVQLVTSLRASNSKRHLTHSDSFGARLKNLEDSIANLDQQQAEAVIESVEGVQRIRGLAGSGKTIVLALKASYLHAQNPDWDIAVTFNTRSLKEQFKRLIHNFTIEQTGTEPDWEKLHVINAWGAPGTNEKNGIYQKFCMSNGVSYYDYQNAKLAFGEKLAFGKACELAINNSSELVKQCYDVILIDEAQDFPASFLKLCYSFLREPKRLIYAYDELQTLTGEEMPPPEEIFGKNSSGQPLVTLTNEGKGYGKQDIILEKCYRNSRPLLASAHALGFGIYRSEGLVQFFDQDSLWEEVGYELAEGELIGGSQVCLRRSPDTSPLFLENHSTIDELIDVRVFDDAKSMNIEVFKSILKNIREDELKPEDILVINPNPLTTKEKISNIRGWLFDEEVDSELAGVTTSRDIFKKEGAVTFTGIFRAKGNEAGMVYVINAQDCNSGYLPGDLALARNRLFTAITRSKSWVRVWGFGPKMQALKDEWERLKENGFDLRFRYPNSEEKSRLKLINRDLNTRDRTKKMKFMRYLKEIAIAIENGEMSIDELPADIVNQIVKKEL